MSNSGNSSHFFDDDLLSDELLLLDDESFVAQDNLHLNNSALPPTLENGANTQAKTETINFEVDQVTLAAHQYYALKAAGIKIPDILDTSDQEQIDVDASLSASELELEVFLNEDSQLQKDEQPHNKVKAIKNKMHQ
jgi:hypothetical protein